MIPEKPFAKAHQALAGAKLATARMAAARSADDREHEWRSFLNWIDQVLTKLAKGYRGFGGQIEPWIGAQVSIQRADPLLLYLAEARDADQHTVGECVEVTPGRYEFTVPGTGPNGGAVHIESLVVQNGRVVEYRGNAPAIERVTPARMEVVAVTSRGRQYDPPEEHLGSPVESRDPLVLAGLAIRHYERLLTEFGESFGVARDGRAKK